MKVYRLTKTMYSNDLAGTGTKLFGGRWNHKDIACIYTAESRALAVLEYSVNTNIDYIPRALSMCVFEIDENQIQTIEELELPGNWRETPAPRATKDFGSERLEKGILILRIPSLVIPDEYNYILNPTAKNSSFKLIAKKDFVFDLRIKKNN